MRTVSSLFVLVTYYNQLVKTWDVVIIGGGVIGLSLAWRLRRDGASVLIVEKGEPAREATHAAGGMIAHCDPHNPPALASLIAASGRMYPEFVRELRESAFESPDLRSTGAIAFLDDGESPTCDAARVIGDEELARIEPLVCWRGGSYFLPESSVDPRKLGSALEKALRQSGGDFVTGSPVTEVAVLGGRAAGVRTATAFYAGNAVVNCAGAWAAMIKPIGPPTRPVKGQMICVVPQPGPHRPRPLIQHVIRAPEVYIIPRSDGRLVLGATVEEAGFDKRVDADTVQRLQHAAARVAPVIAEMRIHEVWAGLRPGTPDDLPILGPTSLPGYFAATGHYRDGIMLAPITAHLLAQLLNGHEPDCDLTAFSPLRFSAKAGC
jgi:glycine oxidase